ncbi:hypothetical protein LJC27_08240, partial [Christensenellaceae bacterium OttesenSCG-928-M15]|nr:hypothetical protein [Christensenellaceae bacterium OttesenSCG-928-M15]
RICKEINRHGYSLHPDDLYTGGSWEQTSIRALLIDENLTEAAALSADAGYPSDIEKVGTIGLIMANTSGNDVITLYYVDGTLELAFVQVNGTDEIRKLGER